MKLSSPMTAAATTVVFASLCFDVAFGFATSSHHHHHHHHHHHYPTRRTMTDRCCSTTTTTTVLYDGASRDVDGMMTELEDAASSYFRMQQIPTATSGDRLDHIVECSDHGGCDVEEMMNMIDELEELNAECQNAMSRECNLDAVAARNVLKVALASKVAMEDALSKEEWEECVTSSSADNDDDDDDDNDPFASLADMEDYECHWSEYYARQLPTATTAATSSTPSGGSDGNTNAVMKLDRIIECAEGVVGTAGVCDVEEMLRMIDELEKLNMECEGALSRECSLDAVAARNILKVALASNAIR